MNSPKFDIVNINEKRVLIRDIGPWDSHPTVTNNPQAVIDKLNGELDNRRLFYIDSEGEMDTEIVVKDGRFDRFKFLPESERK